VEVSLEGCTAPALRVTSLLPSLLVVSVARVPLGTMLAPRTHAHPTKLVLALLARHMARKHTIVSSHQRS
jgi:hypothetical protein